MLDAVRALFPVTGVRQALEFGEIGRDDRVRYFTTRAVQSLGANDSEVFRDGCRFDQDLARSRPMPITAVLLDSRYPEHFSCFGVIVIAALDSFQSATVEIDRSPGLRCGHAADPR